MTQLKFDLAEILVTNRAEIFDVISPDVFSALETKYWFESNSIGSTFEEMFAEFIEYRLRWFLVEDTGKSLEEVSEVVDIPFIADVYGGEVLGSNYWGKKFGGKD